MPDPPGAKQALIGLLVICGGLYGGAWAIHKILGSGVGGGIGGAVLVIVAYCGSTAVRGLLRDPRRAAIVLTILLSVALGAWHTDFDSSTPSTGALLAVQITGSELVASDSSFGSEHVVYVISAREVSTWSSVVVKKRYSEFEALHASLLQTVDAEEMTGNVKQLQLAFPSHRLQKNSDSVRAERVKSLQRYLDTVLALTFDKPVIPALIMKFIGIYDNVVAAELDLEAGDVYLPMASTPSDIGRTIVRLVVASAFLFVPEAGITVVIDLALPFLPPGHVMTTGGRHDDEDGQTWLMCKRSSLFFLTMAHLAIMYAVAKYADKNLRQKLAQTVPGNAGSDITKGPAKMLRAGVQIAIGAVFVQRAVEMYHDAPPSIFTCDDSTSLEFGTELYTTFVMLAIEQITSSLMLVYMTGLRVSLALTHRPPTYYFWWLVLVYCPTGDVWLPMAMECCRIAIELFETALRQRDPTRLLKPLTMVLEAMHWGYSIYMHVAVQPCSYPHILWLRVPGFILAFDALARNVGIYLSWALQQCCFHGQRQEIHAWVPVNPDADGAEEVAGMPGRWRVVTGSIVLATKKKQVEIEGAMRVPYDCQDPDSVLGLGKRLVAKQYNASTMAHLGAEECEMIMYRDSNMQHECRLLASRFNQATPQGVKAVK